MNAEDIDTTRYYLNRRKAHCASLMQAQKYPSDDTIVFVAKEMADIRTQEAKLARAEATLKAA